MGQLFEGFDLCAPSTSVSLTINGPAPAVLAMFLNTAVDQQLAQFRAANAGAEPTAAQAAEIKAATLSSVRGTVQVITLTAPLRSPLARPPTRPPP